MPPLYGSGFQAGPKTGNAGTQDRASLLRMGWSGSRPWNPGDQSLCCKLTRGAASSGRWTQTYEYCESKPDIRDKDAYKSKAGAPRTGTEGAALTHQPA